MLKFNPHIKILLITLILDMLNFSHQYLHQVLKPREENVIHIKCNANFQDSCSCTSLRSSLLSNLLADLFSGLQAELGGCGSQMPCQLLKCLEDRHNWDKSSIVKTNLRNYFSQLLIGELDIAIATSIEKYHAKVNEMLFHTLVLTTDCNQCNSKLRYRRYTNGSQSHYSNCHLVVKTSVHQAIEYAGLRVQMLHIYKYEVRKSQFDTLLNQEKTTEYVQCIPNSRIKLDLDQVHPLFPYNHSPMGQQSNTREIGCRKNIMVMVRLNNIEL